jgi:hypothetical protein
MLNTTLGRWPAASNFGTESDYFAPNQSAPPGKSKSPVRSSKTAAPTTPTRVKRDDPPRPKRTSDDFADYVLRLGKDKPLTSKDLADTRADIMHSVLASRDRLADRQTADAIGNTLLDALAGSPTFQALVGYNLHHSGEFLGDLRYRNVYTRDSEYQGPRKEIGDLKLSDLRSPDPSGRLPIVSIHSTEAGYSNDVPYVSIGAAPDADHPAYHQWQEMLIHEVIHHLTGADDPPDNLQQDHLGPTENLAQSIGRELGWNLPQFNGYADPNRMTHLTQTNRTATLDAAQRHADHDSGFFDRLAHVSSNTNASADFHELDPPGAVGGVAHNASLAPENGVTAEDLARLRFHNGEVSFLPFAESAPAGKPDGYQSAYAASSAPWETQARFFQYGEPVGGNPHVRQFDFPDGSKTVITAYQPTLAWSDLTSVEKVATEVGTTAAGAVIGYVGSGFNPNGAYVGGAVGFAIGKAIADKYPYDRIWQGYKIQTINKGETSPSYEAYTYTWDNSPLRVGLLSRLPDPSLYPDYADSPPDKYVSYWRWKTGNAPERT